MFTACLLVVNQQMSKVDHMYREGAEDTIDVTVEGDMFDRKLTIKYPFSPYKCSACWDFMECPEKLVEHTSAKHKDDFIVFS